ncbi:30S ribosomal protein S15 [Oceanotoga sp. DSM 15011]|uniref:Small ribosomal subunit protein uS15 n=1 Tax=Oceanotoga teriensis TaxID=515440 RepID=A0AA45C4R7_9BACT|nr:MULTISPECIES: 30S ribosomal protein S15 [Oceanotoga]MDN5343170.1 small subunit ribosomal protein [Oceanotoga sp.]MDO7977748.1 30S ribosomal protein S15 [Oceanotoga teriensis]PWJ87137.1 small subunit ribosomal protein S15 [Oceanotoga teriensis]UYP00747.1 30S ribosomal protein S15 [Oceanotoga sp. DSM 15011]
MARGLEQDYKKELIEEFKINQKDTGSVEVQVAILSARIKHITDHLKKHPKDFHSRRGLMSMVGKRRKMLKYLKKEKPELYQEMIKKLQIRG